MVGEPSQYFILVYRLPEEAVEVVPFGDDVEAAGRRYRELEIEHRGQDGVEVVLVGADSIETIHRTHSHYFVKDKASDLFERVLRDLLDDFGPSTTLRRH